MIGYHKKFIFIHIPKTAGQSVTSTLRSYALPWHKRIVQWTGRRIGRRTKYDHYNLYPGGGHGTAMDCVEFLGREEYEKYFSFAVVRNPWDRVVSQHGFAKLRPRSPLYKIAMEGSFEEFIEHLSQRGGPTQLSYISDDDGKIVVDKVARFETLKSDLDDIFAMIGIPSKLPHKNKSQREPYQKLYTPRTRDMVAELFADDIKAFGYTYEGAPS